METWKATIKEKGNDILLTPEWVSSKFEYIKDAKQREYVTRKHLKEFWGLDNKDVEWYTLEKMDKPFIF